MVAVLVVVGLAALGWLVVRPSLAERTAFGKQLNQQQLQKLRSFSLPVYVPKDLTVGPAIIGTDSRRGVQFVDYGINMVPGQGIAPGSYSISEYTLTKAFNPPTDCGIIGGETSSRPLPCPLLATADASMPAYVYQGLMPGTVVGAENASKTKTTIYVKRGKEVIAIQAVGAAPQSLYDIVKDMKRVGPLDLPAGSTVAFY